MFCGSNASTFQIKPDLVSIKMNGLKCWSNDNNNNNNNNNITVLIIKNCNNEKNVINNDCKNSISGNENDNKIMNYNDNMK